MLDVRGSLKNTKLSMNPLVVVEELFSNAIDAYLIRKAADSSVSSLNVRFRVEFFQSDLLGSDLDMVLTCEDNGAGLDDEQTKAFLTKDTSYKDDLAILGIGQCKGSGRIQYFHHFARLELQSVFLVDHKLFKRTLHFEESQKQIKEDMFDKKEIKRGTVGTRVILSGLKQSVRTKVFSGRNIEDDFSARSLGHHILVFFMHRLVGLKEHLGDFAISFVSSSKVHGKKSDPVSHTLTPRDLPDVTAVREAKVFERDPETGVHTAVSHILTLSHYRLDATQYDLPSNIIALCAKSSPVQIITDQYLKPKAVENNPLNGFYHVVLIEGALLDEKVNEQRDGFDIPLTFQRPDLFLKERVALEDILQAISNVIEEMVNPPDGIAKRSQRTSKRNLVSHRRCSRTRRLGSTLATHHTQSRSEFSRNTGSMHLTKKAS